MKMLALKNNVIAILTSTVVLGAGVTYFCSQKVPAPIPIDAEKARIVAETTNTLLSSLPKQEDPFKPRPPLPMPTWQWYWNEDAQIDVSDRYGCYGNDIFSLGMKTLANDYMVPFWNQSMHSEFNRGLILLVVTGAVFGLSAAAAAARLGQKSEKSEPVAPAESKTEIATVRSNIRRRKVRTRVLSRLKLARPGHEQSELDDENEDEGIDLCSASFAQS